MKPIEGRTPLSTLFSLNQFPLKSRQLDICAIAFVLCVVTQSKYDETVGEAFIE